MGLLENIVIYGLTGFAIACFLFATLLVLIYKIGCDRMPDDRPLDDYLMHVHHMNDQEIVASAAWHRERLEAHQESLEDWYDEEFGVCDTDAVYEVIWCGESNESLKQRMRSYERREQ